MHGTSGGREVSSRELRGSGFRNQNPPGLSLASLLAEDFRTHESRWLEPGLWAIAVHRFGNWRMQVKPKIVRAPLSMVYRAAFLAVKAVWSIELSYTVKLGRRIRIWHQGGIVLNAWEIGDDVHIRHNTTIGIARRSEPDKRPVVGDRVDIGVGACILGDVTIGHDTIIGANAVVLKSFPPYSTVVGVPARALAEVETVDGAASRR